MRQRSRIAVCRHETSDFGEDLLVMYGPEGVAADE
jgi:hypothetical protein